MDGFRFDELARAAASGASRRSVLKVLTAGFAASWLGFRLPVLAYAQNTVPLGGQCSTLGANSECSQAGGAVVCSDNGVMSDGQFNCCRNAGGSCTADFHCCGGAVCVNGSCGGGGGGSGGLGLGAECSSTTQCSQAGGAVVCASNGIPSDGARNCCRNTGGACSADVQCCANIYCVNGTCGGSSTGTTPARGLALGAQCTSSDQCTQSGGATVCANNGFDGDGPLNCCRNEGGACTGVDYSADCCGGLYCVNGTCTSNTTGGLAIGAECSQTGQCSQAAGPLVCASNGLDADGALNCCRTEGGGCGQDSECCGGLTCENGVCTGGGSGSGGTIGLGEQCTATDECSQEGGAVSCADNGIASDGALNCCRYEGGTCGGGSHCCGGLDCTNSVCTPIGGTAPGGTIGLGGECASDADCTADGGASYCRDNGIETDGALNCCRYEGGACGGGSHCCAGLNCTDGVCA
jgi:hypothetical protein